MDEAKYEIDELAKKARKIFGTAPEVVTTALITAGFKSATLDEAKKAVKSFLEREVN